MRFSPSTGLFYSPALHSKLPADCIDVDQDEYQRLLAGRSEGQVIEADDTGRPQLVSRPTEPPTTEQLCDAIDRTADATRRLIAGDSLRAVEYAQAEAEALGFVAAGYPADAVPRTVAAWAINGRTAQEAADSILAEAVIYRDALYSIRERRLTTKEKVRELMANGDVEQALQVAETCIAALKSDFVGYAP